jgi:DNA ligase (NAD+)
MDYKKRTGSLEGLTFVFTGSLEYFTRGEAKQAVESQGGRVVSNVSTTVDYVVVGNDPGSKLDAAQNRGIPIIHEQEFVDMLP